jgi:hypothetical protein
MKTRPFLSVLVSALLALGTASVVGAQAAAADEGDRCDWQTYKTKYRILSHHRGAALTHVRGVNLAPHSGFSHKKTVAFRKSYRSKVQFEANASFTAGKIIAKGSVSVGVQLMKAGSVTQRSDWTDRYTIHNKTNKNKRYALFAGTSTYFGRYKVIRCDYFKHVIVVDRGHWRSWAYVDGGSAMCGKAPRGLLSRKALRVVC